MFNSAKPGKDEPQYLFNLTKYYKIWFSKYPDMYMGVENELRFIRMRINNPTAILSFIYSATCLNQQTIDALNKFCEKYNINAIQFEDLQSQMVEPEDKALYSIATEEIARALDGTDGTMAGASDCARILTPLIFVHDKKQNS